MLSDKTGVSDRAATTIATAALSALTSVQDSIQNVIVDRHKIRRAKKRVREELQGDDFVEDPFESFYFDGRKDLTKVKTDEGHIKNVREEHNI